VILVAFKAIDSVLRGQNGGFDSHTLPPIFRAYYLLVVKHLAGRAVAFALCGKERSDYPRAER
jgi:hypothetical protein